MFYYSIVAQVEDSYAGRNIQERADREIYQDMIFTLEHVDSPDDFWEEMGIMVEKAAPSEVNDPEIPSEDDIEDAIEVGFETALQTIGEEY